MNYSFQAQQRKHVMDIIHCLADVKYIIIRNMLVRTIYEQYFNLGFQALYDEALSQTMSARGQETESFLKMCDLFKADPSIAKLQDEIHTTLK